MQYKLKLHAKRTVGALLVATLFASTGVVFAQAVGADLISSPDLTLGVMSTKSPNLTGVQIGATLNAGSMCRLRLGADVSSEQKHALLAAGCQITPNSYVIGGLSKAVERFDRYDTNLNGDGAFVRVDMTNLAPAVRKVFVEAITGRTHDKTLDVTDKAYQNIRIEDMPTFVRTITEKGVFRTTTLLIGGRYNTFGLGADVNVGANGLMTLKFSTTKFQIDGESSTENNFLVGYSHYLTEQNARAGIKLGTNGRIILDAEKGIGNGWSVSAAAYKDTKNDKGSGIYARVNYAFGGVTPLIGVRPEQTSLQLDEAVRNMHSNTEYAVHNLLSIAKIKESTVKIKISETAVDVVKVVEPVVVPPVVVPPVVVVPGVDSPTTISLSLTQNTTTGNIDALCNIVDADGVTGTCTITNDFDSTTQTNPISASSYVMTYSGAPSGTVVYTLTLVGTKKVKNADNTFTTVNINQQTTTTLVTSTTM